MKQFHNPNKLTSYLGMRPIRTVIKTLAMAALAVTGSFGSPLSAQTLERVYSGPIRLPDFQGRDRAYARFRTRISQAMATGPDFAWRYAFVRIGCGTGCSFNVIGDVATGRVYEFPYYGEDYDQLDLSFSVKGTFVIAKWYSNGICYTDFLDWNGNSFVSNGPQRMPKDACKY